MTFSRKHKVALLGSGLTLFLGVLLLGVYAQPSDSQAQSAVSQFPQQKVMTLINSETIESSTIFQAEYQLVNVWASWCGVCRTEHDFLMGLADQGIPLFGVNYRDNRPQALNYLSQLGNPYQMILHDPKGHLSIDLGVIGTPETYVINRKGEVVYKYVGLLDEQVWTKFISRYFEFEQVSDQKG